MTKVLLTFVLFLALMGAAQAKSWRVDYEHSKLGFAGEQSGEKFQGGFKNFLAEIVFDPEHPEMAKISALVDITSAYAGSPDRDSMLPQKDWFDSAHFPQAQFMTTHVRQISPGHYEAEGTVTIKGMTHNVTLPFTLVQEGDHWRAQGSTTLMRNEFMVGQGMFTDETYVKYAVDVTIDIVAK